MSIPWRTAVLAAGALALALGLRMLEMRVGGVELDEFQHIHAAYLVAIGQRPYVDFFEHHAPLFYFVAGPFIDRATANFDTVIGFRWLALACHVGVLAVGTVLAAAAGRAAAVTALTFLVSEIFSFAWGTTALLDSFAVPFILLSALALARRPESRTAHLVAGVLLGTAVLFTQKAVFAALAPLAFVVERWAGAEGRPVTRPRGKLLSLGLGVTLPVAALAWLLGADGLRAFWHDVVVLNGVWKARRWPLGEAFIIASYGAPIWFLAGVGMLGALYRAMRRTAFEPAVVVPVLYLASLLVGTLVMPVVWYEYFVEIGPFAAVVAAFAAVDLARSARLLPGTPLLLPPKRAVLHACILGVTLVSVVSLVLRLMNGHFSPTVSTPGLAVTLGAVALGIIGARRAYRRGERTRVAVALLLLIVAFPLVNQVEWLRRPDATLQRAAVNFVLTHTAPDDVVFDGYSGFGVFRPHAYRYWFLHDEMQLMLTREERGQQIVAALEDPRVKVAIRDSFSHLLEPEVDRYLDAHFTPGWNFIWLRRDGGES